MLMLLKLKKKKIQLNLQFQISLITSIGFAFNIKLEEAPEALGSVFGTVHRVQDVYPG